MALGAVGGRRSAAVLMAAVAAVGVISCGTELAAASTWLAPAGSTYSWFEPLAWSSNVPTSSDITYVTNGGAPTVSSASAVSGTLYLGYSASQSGGLIVAGTGQVSLSSTAYVGYSGYGWVQQSGGALVPYSLKIAYNSASSGNYNLSDGTLQVGYGGETIGSGTNSTAEFNQSGGIHSVTSSGSSSLTIAYAPGAVASYSLTGGQLSSYSLQIGYGSTSSGVMTQSGGQNSTGTLNLANSSNSAGSYALGGSGLLSATTEYIGYVGVGVFNQTGGTNRAGSFTGQSVLYIGYQSGSQGTYNLSGNGQLIATGAEYVGYGSTATGIMAQTGGINSLGAAPLYVAYQPGATGIYQLAGTGLLTAGTEYIGNTGTGTFTGMGMFQQSGGTNVADAINVGINGRYDLTGGVVQAKASFTTTGKVTIGDVANPAASSSFTTPALYVGGTNFGPSGSTGSGTLTLTSSASVDVSTTLRVWSPGVLTIKSGTLIAPSLVNDGAVIVTGGSLAGPQGALASITGTGAITVGAGTTVKSGYVWQGSVAVAGTLQLNHSGSASSFNDLSIAPGGKVMLADDLASWNYTGASPAGVLRQYLKSGSNGGDWAGTGLASSAAAGDVDRVLGIGYIEASDMGVSSWGGIGVDTTTLLLKIVPLGDADMDGTITMNDYVLLDRGLALGYSGWSNGDFNYDGVVDAADNLIIDRTYAIQQGILPSPALLAAREAQFGSAYVAELMASVPEPGIAGAAALLGVVGRRRRR